MRLNEFIQLNFLPLEFVYTYVSYFIATCEEASLWAEGNAADRVDHLVDLFARVQVNLRPVLVPIERFCLEVVVYLIVLVTGTPDEDHLAHVLAISVPCQTAIDFTLFLVADGGVNEMPKADSSVR